MAGMRDHCTPVWALLLALHLVGPLCQGLLCPVGEWRENRTLDLQPSRDAGASVAVVNVQSMSDKDECSRLCCEVTVGTCTVASFEFHGSGNGTCYLYNCMPLPSCIMTSRTGTSSYLTSESVETSSVTESASTQVSVHGDGTLSKGRKGVISKVTEDLPLKHDNTTVKPRKGVLKEENVNTVKARKGVETSSLDISTEIFSDDPLVANGSYEDEMNPSAMNLSLGLDTTNTTQNVSEPYNTTTTTKAAHSSAEFFSEDLGNFTIVLFLNSTSTSQTPNSSIKSGELSLETTTSRASSTTATPSVKLSSETESALGIVNDEKDSLVSQEETDWEAYHNATSLHLVIGLVLGLMLLLTVLGIVAKRIHDSWQRRHYHRMDFLIDGMYHGEA